MYLGKHKGKERKSNSGGLYLILVFCFPLKKNLKEIWQNVNIF